MNEVEGYDVYVCMCKKKRNVYGVERVHTSIIIDEVSRGFILDWYMCIITGQATPKV